MLDKDNVSSTDFVFTEPGVNVPPIDISIVSGLNLTDFDSPSFPDFLAILLLIPLLGVNLLFLSIVIL